MAKSSPKIPLFFLVLAIAGCFSLILLLTPVTNNQAEDKDPPIFLPAALTKVETKSQFKTKTSQKKQKVPFKTVYQKDPNLEWGKVVISQKGENGEDLVITEKLFWKGLEIGKRNYTKKITLSKPQINLIGTKFTPGTIETSTGKLTYKGKARVFATSYDKNCRGCNETTATGAKLGFGVAAVDPLLISLGTKIYVEGYGQAIAADTGGAIKGARIDLAFDDVRNGFWRSRWTDVYLLE